MFNFMSIVFVVLFSGASLANENTAKGTPDRAYSFEYGSQIHVLSTEQCLYVAKTETLLTFVKDFRLSLEFNNPQISHLQSVAISATEYEVFFEVSYYGANLDGFSEQMTYTYKTKVQQRPDSCIVSKPILEGKKLSSELE